VHRSTIQGRLAFFTWLVNAGGPAKSCFSQTKLSWCSWSMLGTDKPASHTGARIKKQCWIFQQGIHSFLGDNNIEMTDMLISKPPVWSLISLPNCLTNIQLHL